MLSKVLGHGRLRTRCRIGKCFIFLIGVLLFGLLLNLHLKSREIYLNTFKMINSEKNIEVREIPDVPLKDFPEAAVDLISTKADKSKLQNLVQNKFHQLQNPINCETARKFVCKVQTLCGIGCELHHLAICMFIALGTNRTLITNTVRLQPWFDEVFEPLSQSCQASKDEILKQNYREWSETVSNDVKDVQLNVQGCRGRGTVFVPGSLPSSLLPSIQSFNRDPVVWWIGQVMAFICRFTPEFQKEVNSYQQKLGLDNNDVILGLHIRRTDKITSGEGKLQTNDKYMIHVKDWYNEREKKTKEVIKRRVYVATDDVEAVPNLRKEYPDYTFICDEDIPKVSTPGVRVSLVGLKGIMKDTYALARCNFVVCTFSSNIGRLVYEFMHFNKVDPSDDIISLDIRNDFPIPHVKFFNGTLDHRIQHLSDKYSTQLQPFGVVYPNFKDILKR